MIITKGTKLYFASIFDAFRDDVPPRVVIKEREVTQAGEKRVRVNGVGDLTWSEVDRTAEDAVRRQEAKTARQLSDLRHRIERLESERKLYLRWLVDATPIVGEPEWERDLDPATHPFQGSDADFGCHEDGMSRRMHPLRNKFTLTIRCENGHEYKLEPVKVVEGAGYYSSDRDFCKRCGEPAEHRFEGE